MWDCLAAEENSGWTFPFGNEFHGQLGGIGSRWGSLNLLGGDTSNGNEVGIWGGWDTNHMGQHWMLDDDSSAIYMNGTSPRKCLQSRSSAQGDAVEIWDCNGEKNQKWKYVVPDPNADPVPSHDPMPPPPSSSVEPEEIINIVADDWCLDVEGSEGKVGKDVRMGSCLNNTDQMWLFDHQTLKMRFAGDGLNTYCLDGSWDHPLRLQLCDESPPSASSRSLSFQGWYLEPPSGAFKNGRGCLDLSEHRMKPFLEPTVRDCDWMAPRARRWYFQTANPSTSSILQV